MNRILYEKSGSDNNVLMIVIGGLHGNELSGVKAIQSVFNTLEESNIKVHGKIVGIAGNLQAISEKKRFLNYDLNRCWTQDFIDEILAKPESLCEKEDIELRELYHLISDLLSENYRQTYIVDLHATSADNGNFIVHAGMPAYDSVIKSLKLPIVMNLDDYIQGTLLRYFKAPTVTAFAFEGGQIGAEKTKEVHTYGIWQLMSESGLIDEQHDMSMILHYQELLGSMKKNQPNILRVLHRHEVKPHDFFHMKPGFDSFQFVEKGELLAEDKSGEIKAPIEGRIFMPLYQNAGDDGFFIVEEV
ncbi:succinylglutamate desuccinylase/aspartoacylase family protein [Roseivirga sp. E12]|uniref:succinylglutamate desuccinylase/aspartoacylase family protein n=1 Tax=Roseivirga sp. E12 TaxID=2819237 RepID=UPI001ABC21FE|nr:succinylglutamate desuccinylase/aspartoacylase family protein [Roseivirga sp. E12]MBO3699379.1 succinylglutamate desuccinylase/aspartoacylase family protein [Roseivirga sp. E12]